MAYNLFYQAQPWGVESEESSPILDDHILDNGFESSLDMSRRESFVDSGIYSPQARDWIDYDHDMVDNQQQAMPVSFEHSNGTNNPFVKLESQNFGQQGAWASRANMSGTATPTIYEAPVAFGTAFDATPYMPQPFAPVPAAALPNSSAFDAAQMFSPQPSSLAPSTITSPVQEHQWALPTEQPKQQGQQPTPNSSNQNSPNAMKRTRPSSPAPRAHSPLNIRRDGIRKKNARFEIPAERTLLTIDHLIAQSGDDQEIKELKQQKRLLRNRQAALDSRQRKKQHTERLEEEKKIHSTIITELEEKLALLQMRDHEWKMRNDSAMKEMEKYRHQVEVLQMEKEDLVKQHTIETGDLRKKNNYLVNQCQKLEQALESRAAPGSASYGDEFDDLDDLDSGNFFSSPFNDNNFDMRMDAPVKKEKADDDKAPAPGLLLILLLCGAFVASSKVASKALPPLPQPIRNASAGILQTIFNDAGVQHNSQGRVMSSLEATTTDWLSIRNDGGSKMVGIGSSTLDALNAELSRPSAQQERAEIAQLTVEEYNGVTSKEFREPESISIKGRRHIEEGLASMRASKGSAAEVYTRSLLWDKVDAEVVRRFAAFAQQAQAASAQANAEHGNHGMSV